MKVLTSFMMAVVCCSMGAAAQTPATVAADAPRVFLDCDHYCDHTFMRTELNWLNWVRDAADAQIHVLVTRQSTGGGGAEWTLNLIGRRDFEGRADTLKFVSAQDASDDLIRQGMLRTLKAGLVPYLMNTTLAERLQITLGAASSTEKAAGSATTRDPWNFWVFSASLRSNLNGESSQRSSNYWGNFSANRTTTSTKIQFGVGGNYDESVFELVDDTVLSISKGYNVNFMIVKSVGNHWSAGFQGGANSATYNNIALGFSGGPALEWSLWPYAQATRRSLTLRYSPGVRSYDYLDVTIFDKSRETHPSHNLRADLGLRQRWGSTGFSFNLNQYLHDRSVYNASLFGNANVRLFKGFSFDFFGEYSRVHDQLALAKRELTEEEILLRRRQLETAYRYFGGFGIRYSFGSMFNNVVNPRFGDNTMM